MDVMRRPSLAGCASREYSPSTHPIRPVRFREGVGREMCDSSVAARRPSSRCVGALCRKAERSVIRSHGGKNASTACGVCAAMVGPSVPPAIQCGRCFSVTVRCVCRLGLHRTRPSRDAPQHDIWSIEARSLVTTLGC
ncbi:hypothetical protein BD414DRAFT_293145 [Trametes punicea]|nr:hypothetical protein BD414DRAFT_293145 [Trametes punicea]